MPASLSTRSRADLLLVLAAFFWGTTFVAQSIAGRAGLAFLYNAACFLLASLLLLPFFPKGYVVPRPQWKWMVGAGLLLFGGSALQQLGLRYTSVANASFLTSLYVVFTPLLLWLGYRERPAPADFLAVAVAGAGAFLLSTGGAWELQRGDVLETLGALFWGVHVVLVAKHISAFSPVPFASGQFFVCGLMSLVLGLATENPAPFKDPAVLAATAYRAVLAIGIGFTLQLWGQRHTPPTHAGLIFSLESVFATATAWLVLEEYPGPLRLGGGALILGAIALSQLKTAYLARHS